MWREKELIQFILMFLVLKWTATECLSHVLIWIPKRPPGCLQFIWLLLMEILFPITIWLLKKVCEIKQFHCLKWAVYNTYKDNMVYTKKRRILIITLISFRTLIFHLNFFYFVYVQTIKKMKKIVLILQQVLNILHFIFHVYLIYLQSKEFLCY